ncbi:MAG TPA: helix-turn-helix domain-containing protein [Lacipirellulaceae bacterium]|nr:helix-turn-helix domain-containing protein [Lacipirellulaceae bacterium]HMP06337.1 helix-turn-helix domain-containing protein [Lacipirellulaceae bacterium]
MSVQPETSTYEIGQEFKEIIGPAELAEILSLSVKTIYGWIRAGRLKGCCRKRGKHILIDRRKALTQLLQGPAWR